MARSSKPGSKRPSDTEYERFAKQFVDLIVDPKRPWLLHYIVAGGLDQVPADDEIESGGFALHVLKRIERLEKEGTELIEASLFEALNNRDRKFLVSYTKDWSQKACFSREDMKLFLKMGSSSSLRQSFKNLNSKFGFRSGGRTKITARELYDILNRAEQLRPAIEKILKELSSNTSHTLEEILEYCRKDYPETCNFLSLHIQFFRQAFNDKSVLRRATKRISARARALADAMAGTEYGLAFSTSIERVGAARRFAIREKPPSNSPQIED
jgi:hypothetical protein